jgi:hypothetical protein
MSLVILHAIVLSHFPLSRVILLQKAERGRRGCSLICTEARAHATAHVGGRWVLARARAHSRGCAGRSRAGCGRALWPGSVGLCLTGPGDGPTLGDE